MRYLVGIGWLLLLPLLGCGGSSSTNTASARLHITIQWEWAASQATIQGPNGPITSPVAIHPPTADKLAISVSQKGAVFFRKEVKRPKNEAYEAFAGSYTMPPSELATVSQDLRVSLPEGETIVVVDAYIAGSKVDTKYTRIIAEKGINSVTVVVSPYGGLNLY